jgi:hypothetical protein
MKRTLVILAAVVLLSQWKAEGSAQTWGTPRFASTSHDFGTVARGAVAEHLFWFTNTCGSDVHVRGVRTTCGCTTPSVVHATVKSGERGAIRAAFNTRSFTGQRSATIIVVFDRPRYTEVQLHVRGYVRRDVVFHPGSVDFGTVRQGQGAERVIGVEYAGRNDWQITAIRVPAPHYDVRTRETRRGAGRVGYELVVRLAEDAPPGTIETELVLETNDRSGSRVPLAVSGQIVPPLSVSPALLYVGNVPCGREVKTRLVVRASEAFRILAVECDDPRFDFEIGDQAKTLHFIPVAFRAGEEAGPLSVTVRILSDLPGVKPVEITASGTVGP